MKKPFKMPYILFLAFLISVLNYGCKGNNLPGVYAVVKLSLKVSFGGGMDMDREDLTLLLRADGTFTDDLAVPNWNTEKKGTYKQVSNKVILTYINSDRIDTCIYEKGELSIGSKTFLKMDNVDKIPAGNYEFTHASSSGGGMSGSPYIGVSGGENYYFDGKGHFSKDGYGVVSISGDNIGGGATKNDPTKNGTYKLNNGELILTYQDKKIEKHSFFASDGETVTAIIDGQFFFMDKKQKNEPLPTAKKLVEEIKEKQGGKAIDGIQNMMMNYTADELKIVNIRNFVNNNDRVQYYKDGKLAQVTQRNQKDSWEWVNGKQKPLDAETEKNMKYNFYTGISALKEGTISTLQKGIVARTEEGFSLNYSVDGIDFKMLVDKEYKIIGESNNISGKSFETQYSNFKEVDGILFPFTEEDKIGDETYTIQFIKIVINDPTNLNWPLPKEIK